MTKPMFEVFEFSCRRCDEMIEIRRESAGRDGRDIFEVKCPRCDTGVKMSARYLGRPASSAEPTAPLCSCGHAIANHDAGGLCQGSECDCEDPQERTSEPSCEHPVRAGVSNGKGMIVDVECGKCHEKLPDQPYTPL